ncbi:MAG TPA: DNA polymerase III subunit beta [Victivallales bacterium]|nr:DNA polymerase III subunit beta [Victivallales bacterium]HRU00177.1 DNA polymerase III subunit beta [Victivallales bacterium]
MKIIVQKNLFADAIQKLTSIISSRTTLPILNNVLIIAENDMLTLETTDLDIRITTKIPATIDKTGSTTVPAKRLLMFIRDFQGDKITLETDNSFNLKIESGESSYRLLGISPEEFPPAIPVMSVRKITIPQKDLQRHLSFVSYSTSPDETRKILNGVLLSVKSNIFITVATDGKRLALMEKPIDKFEGSDGDVVIHSRVANELQRIIPKEDGIATIEVGEKMIKFEFAGTILLSKIMEGTFPNYRQVIPTSFSKKFELNRESFYSCIRRIMNVISESNPAVTFTFFNDKITLTANSTDVGEGKESIPVEYKGPEFKFMLNPNNIMDSMKVMTVDKFILQMNDGFSPVGIFGDEGFLYIMMPVRTNK